MNEMCKYECFIKRFLASPSDFTTNKTNLGIITLDTALKMVYEFIEKNKDKSIVATHDMVDSKDRICIIGDICGQSSTFRIVLNRVDYHSTFLFLGNYVGKGPKSLYCILLAYALKMLNPNTILLRGNNETELGKDLWNDILFHFLEVPKSSGSIEGSLVYKNCSKLYHLLRVSFNCLPVCAIVNGSYFFAHGGIPKNPDFLTIFKIVKTPLFIKTNIDFHVKQSIGNDTLNPLSETCLELMWNKECDTVFSLSEFTTIADKGYFKEFTDGVLQDFLKKNNFKMLIHSHEPVNGYRINKSKTSLTINSSQSKDCERAVAFMDNKGHVEVRFFF